MESRNEYVIQVKGNQQKLLKAIKLITEAEAAHDKFYSLDKKRGRIENRDVTIYKAPLNSDPFKEWKGLKTIIHVHSHGTRKGREYTEHHYYISSKTDKLANYFAKGIRSHWGIENRLHWVKDVILNEDHSGIRSGIIAGNLSLIKSALINLFRLNGYLSIKYAIEKFANKPEKSMMLLNISHI